MVYHVITFLPAASEAHFSIGITARRHSRPCSRGSSWRCVARHISIHWAQKWWAVSQGEVVRDQTRCAGKQRGGYLIKGLSTEKYVVVLHSCSNQDPKYSVSKLNITPIAASVRSDQGSSKRDQMQRYVCKRVCVHFEPNAPKMCFASTFYFPSSFSLLSRFKQRVGQPSASGWKTLRSLFETSWLDVHQVWVKTWQRLMHPHDLVSRTLTTTLVGAELVWLPPTIATSILGRFRVHPVSVLVCCLRNLIMQP